MSKSWRQRPRLFANKCSSSGSLQWDSLGLVVWSTRSTNDYCAGRDGGRDKHQLKRAGQSVSTRTYFRTCSLIRSTCSLNDTELISTHLDFSSFFLPVHARPWRTLSTSCSTSPTSWLDLNSLEQMERVARSTKDSLRTCSSSPHHDPLLRETHRPRSGMEVEGGACIQCYAPVRFPSCASPILCIPGISISHRPSLKLQSAVSVGAHYSSL